MSISLAVQIPARNIQHFFSPVCPSQIKLRNFPFRDTLASSSSKCLSLQSLSRLAKVYKFSPKCTISHQNVQISCQNMQISCHGEKNAIIIQRQDLLARKKRFFDPRHSRQVPNRPDLSCQMVSREKNARAYSSRALDVASNFTRALISLFGLDHEKLGCKDVASLLSFLSLYILQSLSLCLFVNLFFCHFYFLSLTFT